MTLACSQSAGQHRENLKIAKSAISTCEPLSLHHRPNTVTTAFRTAN